jgi:ABC-type glycerol-3-phosphate transport system permease component
MTVQFGASYLEVTIYLMCVATSLLCAYLLARAYRRGRTKLLIWSALCFAMLAVSNLVLAADVLLLPTIDLTLLNLATSLAAVAMLLYGFIWEAR